jgi:hypothetical protein
VVPSRGSTDAELGSRYTSRHQYVKRVTRAADALADKGYITYKDRKALIRRRARAAAVSSRGRRRQRFDGNADA